MKNIMTRAWEIAETGQKEYGGSKIEYISEALRQAWKESKEEPETSISDNLAQFLVPEDYILGAVGSNNQPHWLAEIKGSHPKYKLMREFVPGNQTDLHEYKIEDGKLYEFCPSRKYNQKYYFMVVDGKGVEFSYEEVMNLVK